MGFKTALSIILLVIFSHVVFAQQKYALVIHGGAGVMSKSAMSDQRQAEYKAKLEVALLTGEKLLKNGATSTEAVVEVIKIMEDSPLFNAGKGAVFTASGENELDASIMEGKNLNAGAIAGVKDIKNPITAARAVMENSEHVMLSGMGASEFARQQGLDMVKNKYFYTKSRHESLKRLQKQDRQRTPSDNTGTVGCVALDIHGNLCAGTSTGGMTNKKYGRIGDSPIIGAGNYANNKTCAVSCTGHGEYYIRLGFARDISALMEYKKLSVAEACAEEIRKLDELGGTGGVIAIDANGKLPWSLTHRACFGATLNQQAKKKLQYLSNN